MRPVSTKIPKNAKYTKSDIIAGTRHELEHTRDRKLAKQTAIQHLNQNWSYYRFLPVAEQMMVAYENRPLVKKKKRRRAPPRNDPMTGLPRWGSMPF